MQVAELAVMKEQAGGSAIVQSWSVEGMLILHEAMHVGDTSSLHAGLGCSWTGPNARGQRPRLGALRERVDAWWT